MYEEKMENNCEYCGKPSGKYNICYDCYRKLAECDTSRKENRNTYEQYQQQYMPNCNNDHYQYPQQQWQSPQNSTNHINNSNKKRYSRLIGIAIAIIAFTITIGFLIAQQSGSFSRKATIDDIEIKYDKIDTSYYISFFVTPYVDIDNLQIKFALAGKDGKISISTTKSLGDVKKDIRYIVSFYLIDFDVSNPFKADNLGFTVNGTVSRFA